MAAASATSVAAYPDLDVQIGRRVHQMMWDQKISQVRFGEMTGADQSTVAKRLRGKLGWSASHLVVAASVLNTTVAYLVGETENPAPVGPGGLEPPTYTVEYERLAPVIQLFGRAA